MDSTGRRAFSTMHLLRGRALAALDAAVGTGAVPVAG